MIFRYPGGKSKKSIREQIMMRFPKEYSEYRDVMVGGGGIFFHVPTNKKRWINDIDENLMSVYFALKNDANNFIKKCRSIDPPKKTDGLCESKSGGKAKYNSRLKSEFDNLINNRNSDPALSYLFVNRTVWGGRVNYDIKSRLYFSNPQGWKLVHTKKIEKAAEIIKETRISCSSYENLLFEDGENVVVYVDPPYCVNTDLEKNSRLYKYNFEKEDHIKLCDNIKNSKHKVVISYDDNSFIRKLYKDFNIYKLKWTYCGTSSAKTHSKTKKIGKELIITNY
jgi:DNA adenine methylase